MNIYRLLRRLSVPLISVAISMSACVDPPPYFYAEKITDRSFTLYHPKVGVFPHLFVLSDPQNPFADYGVGEETKWQIESSGDPIAGFYAWSTLLTIQPTGEHQFYTALNLRAIYERSEIEEGQEEQLLSTCIDAFQAVLDHFPESVTYDSSGMIPYGLATLAFLELQELGVAPRGGWVLVDAPDGGQVALRTLDVPSTLPEEETE